MEHIPTRIRALRRMQKRTLKDIASRCGFTVSLLSKIESGKSNPPVATLDKIATALGVSLAELIDPSDQKQTVFISAEKAGQLSPTDKGYAFSLLGSERPDKLMQPFIFEAERGKVTTGGMTHSGEEYIYVLDGQMNYRVGNTSYKLGPGDSLYFNSEEEHDLDPISEKVRFLALFTHRSED